MKPWTKALYVSLISRCDSAAIVSNTSELFPEPETPVNTVSRRLGSSMLTSLRLFSRAPCTRIRSWLSAACRSDVGVWAGAVVIWISVTRDCRSTNDGRRSADLEDADEVAGGVAERAVAHAPRLVGRLLDDVDVDRLQLLEGAVDVLGGEVDAAVGALRHHLRDRAALLVGDAGVHGRRVQHDGGAGLAGGTDRDPVHAAVLDVVAHLEAERVAVEGDGGLRVLVGEEGLVDADVHGCHGRAGAVAGAS